MRKAVNRVKDGFRAQQGPVRKDQSSAPFADAIEAYHDRDCLTFCVPAHSAGRGPAPEFTQWAGTDLPRADLPMTHGVDTRNSAWGVLSTAQELFAEAVGAQQTFFSSNGSSLSVHVAMMSVVGPGDTLVMARNGHKSAFAALIMTGAHPVYVDPFYDEELEIALGPLAGDLTGALDAHPEARAAMVFTPSYYGTCTDVRAMAEACHERDLPLLTDDAWALHHALPGHPDLPEGSLAQGADLAIGSVHKSLTGLSQTSVISVGSERIDVERLQLCLELESSTSSSALLLSSIDGARRQFVRDGFSLLDRAIRSARLLRERLAEEVPELGVTSEQELCSRPGVTSIDPTHVSIEVAPIGLTGYQADDWLREERQIQFELIDHRRVMALVRFSHGEAEIDRLVRALRDLVDAHPDERDAEPRRLPSRAELRTEQAMIPRDAFFARTEQVKPSEVAGRISAEMVTPYPPGIPLVAPGEVYNDAAVDYLEEFVSLGGFVEGASDPSLSKLRVVAE